ncbi:MAG: hypothetical protein ACP5DX_09005 [Paracoccaceae bacterium]
MIDVASVLVDGSCRASVGFRHSAATAIAEFDPEHVDIIRDILGHATLDLAETHYNRPTRHFEWQRAATDRGRCLREWPNCQGSGQRLRHPDTRVKSTSECAHRAESRQSLRDFRRAEIAP